MKHITKHIPNGISILNLLSGAMAVVFSINGNFYIAGIFILIAGLFDFLDGLIARLLKAYTKIGKELDSLADIVSFGFAPSIMLHIYLKKLLLQNYLTADILYIPIDQMLIIFSPFLLLVFAAIRLARFNVISGRQEGFLGLPSPASAIFFASAILSFGTSWFNEISVYAWHWVMLIIVFSALMVMPFRMFSLKFKHWNWKGNENRYIIIGISAILLVTLQSLGISLAIVAYIFLSGLINVLDINQ
ncbi:MAG: CDP-alcohol phosphatidyltransferase family protein [Bacteroidota bacterium]